MGISPENMGGDCFVQAVENAMADSSLLVCHGIVHGPGAHEGIVFPHAWNEDNGIVIDTSNGHDIVMPVDAYYAIGRIDPADVRKYDNGQMMREVVRTGTYGPWDDMFDFDYRVVDDRKASRERTIIGNDMNRVARRALRKRAGFETVTGKGRYMLVLDDIAQEVRDAIRENIDADVNGMWGWESYADYCKDCGEPIVESGIDEFGPYVEVRIEASYNTMSELADALNSIVMRYDRYSYFDMVCPGIMRAYFEYAKIDAKRANRRVSVSLEDSLRGILDDIDADGIGSQVRDYVDERIGLGADLIAASEKYGVDPERLRELKERVSDWYERIYDSYDNVPGYQEAIDAGDALIRSHAPYVDALIEYRGDMLSSDREVAALAFAMDELGLASGGSAYGSRRLVRNAFSGGTYNVTYGEGFETRSMRGVDVERVADFLEQEARFLRSNTPGRGYLMTIQIQRVD